MSGASLSVRERDHGIHFYLDIDSNPLPEKFNVPTLFTQIETSLKLYDAEKFLYRVVAYGDFTPYGGVEAFQVLRGNISEDRFKFVHLPTRIAVCRDKEKNCQKQKPAKMDLSYNRLKQDLLLNTHHENPPYHIIMATSDAQFLRIIDMLKSIGFFVHVEHCQSKCSTCTSDCMTNARAVLYMYKKSYRF